MMHVLKRLITMAAVAAALVGLAASPLFAATNQGDKEISAAFSQDSSTQSKGGGTTTTTNLYFSFGYFLNKNLQLGIAEQLIQVKQGSQDATLQFTQGFGKWHFILDKNPEIVPWVGAYAGLMSLKAGPITGSGTSYGPAAGVKYFVDENTSINAEYQIITTSVSVSGGGASGSADQTDNTLLVGLSVYFGSKK